MCCLEQYFSFTSTVNDPIDESKLIASGETKADKYICTSLNVTGKLGPFHHAIIFSPHFLLLNYLHKLLCTLLR